MLLGGEIGIQTALVRREARRPDACIGIHVERKAGPSGHGAERRPVERSGWTAGGLGLERNRDWRAGEGHMARECPKCSGRMEEGFTLDQRRNGLTLATWVEGKPQKSFWTGLKAPRAARHPIATFRCSRCGYLESYAPSGGGTS